ncbi:hypothetical protein CN918_32290 [Priestia megaterium]|nr:hypothetical protein CN918_32290 [Priestia megaterium]
MNILWNLDGTIFDTFPTLVAAFGGMNEQGGNSTAFLAHVKTGINAVEDEFLFDNERKRAFWRLENNFSLSEKAPFPFVDKVMEVANKNFLVTHRNRASTIALLKHWKLYDYFYEILCLPDDTYHTKPSNDSYSYFLKRYGIDLVIGSREVDLLPARELHLKTCSFQNRDIKADFYLETYQDFPTVLLSLEFYVDYGTKSVRVTPSLLKKLLADDVNHLEHALQLALKDNDSPESILLTIGHAKSLQRTKFYPLDGALFATELGLNYKVILPILFHSLSFGERMDTEHPHFIFYKKCAHFVDKEMKKKIDWLTYCELTTSPTGLDISIKERVKQLLRKNVQYPRIIQNIEKMNYYFEELEKRFG